MPKSFLNCIKKGGIVKTKSMSKGRYQRICFIDGKEYAGEIEVKKGYPRRHK